jgi:hypothetical protein
MTALSKLLVLFAIFLLASLRNAFMILSLVSGGKLIWVNHLIEFVEWMNKPVCKPTPKPTNELSIVSWQCQMEINKMNSKMKTQLCGLCQDKKAERLTFSKQEKDAELLYHLLPKHTQQARVINALSFNNKSPATFKLVVALITIEY